MLRSFVPAARQHPPTEIKWRLTRAREIARCAAQIVHAAALTAHDISFGPSIIETSDIPAHERLSNGSLRCKKRPRR